MTTVILAFVLIACLMTVMAVGVLFGRKPITGSCGGMSALGLETECDICGGNQEICETEQEKKALQASGRADLAYDAMQNAAKVK